MPEKQYRISLTSEERTYLNQLISTGTNKARKLTRARILLLADEGSNGLSKTDEKITESLGVSGVSIAKIRERFVKEGLQEAINEKPRHGRPPRFSGRDEANLTVIACSEPPEGYGRWSVRLLADKLVDLGIVESISRESVRSMLKKGTSSRGLRSNGV